MPAKDDTAEHLERARRGDPEAAAALIAQVAPFLSRQSKKYARKVPAADVDDLYQAGQIAVAHAIERWNPSLASWRTYAMAAGAKGIAREARKVSEQAQRYPTPDAGTEVDCEALPAAAAGWDASAEGPVWGMQDAIAELDPLDRAVMELTHGLTGPRPMDVPEIALALGVRRTRIPQIVARASLQLRQILEERGFGPDVHGKA